MEQLKAAMTVIGIVTATTIAIVSILAAMATAAAGFLIQTFPGSPSLAWVTHLPDNLTRDLALTASAATLLAAAFAAASKFSLFREGKPHLTITQEIHTQALGQSYRLIVVTATLHNTSKVIVKPPAAWCQLDQTAPLDDHYVEYIYEKATEDAKLGEHRQYRWWRLGQADKIWPHEELEVEPNEKHPLTFQFIISDKVTSIGATTAIFRPKKGKSNRSPKDGWMCYTFVELTQSKAKEKP